MHSAHIIDLEFGLRVLLFGQFFMRFSYGCSGLGFGWQGKNMGL